MWWCVCFHLLCLSFSLSLSPRVHKSVLRVCLSTAACKQVRQYHLSRTHTHVLIHNICPSLLDLFKMLITMVKQSNRFDMVVMSQAHEKDFISKLLLLYRFWLEFYIEVHKVYKTPKHTLVLKIYTFFFLVLKGSFISGLPVNLFVIVRWVQLTGAIIRIGNWDRDIFLSFTFLVERFLQVWEWQIFGSSGNNGKAESYYYHRIDFVSFLILTTKEDVKMWFANFSTS